jgi:hypothetical protein
MRSARHVLNEATHLFSSLVAFVSLASSSLDTGREQDMQHSSPLRSDMNM